MATEKEREAFGYDGEFQLPTGPTAPELQYPDLELEMYPGVLNYEESGIVPTAPFETGKGAVTGPWVWILSVSACIVCPCLGIFAIITACLARSSENKKDLEATYFWTKLLKAISFTAVVSSLIMILLLIGALIVAMSIILDDIVRITDSVNQLDTAYLTD